MAVGGVCSGMFGTVAMKVVSVVDVTMMVGHGRKPVSVLPSMKALLIHSRKFGGGELEAGSAVMLLACDHVVRGGSNMPLCFSLSLQP